MRPLTIHGCLSDISVAKSNRVTAPSGRRSALILTGENLSNRHTSSGIDQFDRVDIGAKKTSVSLRVYLTVNFRSFPLATTFQWPSCHPLPDRPPHSHTNRLRKFTRHGWSVLCL